MLRKHKTYSKPKRPFDKERILQEAQLKKEFGLKNKREIWKAEARIKSIREKAKRLISADMEEREALFGRLKRQGLDVNSIADVLSLDKKDFLKRRLQTVLVDKNLASTSRGARQLITHRKVLVDGRVVDSPSYVVSIDMENKIKLKVKPKKVPSAEKPVNEKEKESTNEKIEEKIENLEKSGETNEN